MFTCDRQTALKAIEKLGDRSCCYGGKTWLTRRCDCKYGGPTDTLSEKTGCPELRTLHLLLTNMSDDEFHGRLLYGQIEIK